MICSCPDQLHCFTKLNIKIQLTFKYQETFNIKTDQHVTLICSSSVTPLGKHVSVITNYRDANWSRLKTCGCKRQNDQVQNRDTLLGLFNRFS